MEMDKDFRGNAYIVKHKEVLLNYSGGFADLANEIPNTIETRFASASMSKTFVAVGILQLIEAEKLKFEDTIGAILDFDLKHIDPCVTVRQLLNHTSGVPDYFDESVMGVIGKVVKTSIEEANMSGDKINIDSLEAIAFDPYTHGYYKVSGRVGEAFSDGKKLF